MTITLRAAALLTAAALALTGCQTGDKPGSTTIDQTPTSSAEPTETSTPEPKPVSEPVIQAEATPSYKVPQEISGIVSWEVQRGPKVNAAVAKKVGKAADAFIDEHLLRSDRWQGKYAVKAGEMDALRAKFTPKMFAETKAPIDWYHANQKRFGVDTDGWPKKQRTQASDKARRIGGMFVTSTLVDGGKGPIKQEMTRKVIYPASDGWPMAYIAVTGRRANNTGTRANLTAKITFQRTAEGRYLIKGVYWNIED